MAAEELAAFYCMCSPWKRKIDGSHFGVLSVFGVLNIYIYLNYDFETRIDKDDFPIPRDVDVSRFCFNIYIY